MFCFLFQAAFCVRCISRLQTHHMSHHRRRRHCCTPNWNIEQVFAKGAPGHGVWGIGWGGGDGRVVVEGERETGGKEEEGGRDYLGPSSAVQPTPTLLLLLLLLPIVEPWGPGEAAPCLAAMQPLYHSNLLIVGAQLAHGGFLLEPPNIN